MILLVLPEAERDLAEARDWYDARRPGLGDEFLDAIGEGLRELEQNPERVPLYYRNFRRVILRRSASGSCRRSGTGLRRSLAPWR